MITRCIFGFLVMKRRMCFPLFTSQFAQDWFSMDAKTQLQRCKMIAVCSGYVLMLQSFQMDCTTFHVKPIHPEVDAFLPGKTRQHLQAGGRLALHWEMKS